MKHATHTMHGNSLDAYQSEGVKLGKRALEIYAHLREHGPKTDREIAYAFGKSDLNFARPRCTELIADDWAVEIGNVPCATTGKHVRLVKALTATDRDARIRARREAEEAARVPKEQMMMEGV